MIARSLEISQQLDVLGGIMPVNDVSPWKLQAELGYYTWSMVFLGPITRFWENDSWVMHFVLKSPDFAFYRLSPGDRIVIFKKKKAKVTAKSKLKSLPASIPQDRLYQRLTVSTGVVVKGKNTSSFRFQRIADTKSSINTWGTKNTYGIFPTKNYTRRQESVVSDTVVFTDKRSPTYHYTYTYPCLAAVGPPNSPNINLILENDRVKAFHKSLDKMNEMKVNLAVFLAEGGQSLEMIVGTMKRIAESYRALRRHDYSGALKALGQNPRDLSFLERSRLRSGMARPSVSSLWLELQYGWLPLLSDIHELMDATLQHQHFGLNRFRSAVKRQGVISRTIGTFAGTGLSYDETVLLSATSRSRLIVSVDSPLLATANSWGLLNPLSVAWETTPFSFLVDWFLPIGESLELLTASAGKTLVDGSSSSIYRLDVFRTIRKTSGFDVLANGRVQRTVLYYGRTRETSVVPRIRVKDPRSMMHFFNALALLRQLRK